MVDTHPGPMGFSMPTVSQSTCQCQSRIAAGIPTGSSMAFFSDCRNTLLSRMRTSFGSTDAADAFACSMVSGSAALMKLT